MLDSNWIIIVNDKMYNVCKFVKICSWCKKPLGFDFNNNCDYSNGICKHCKQDLLDNQ